MLTIPEKILFLALAATSAYFAFTGFKRVIDVIGRGDRGYYDHFSGLTERLGESIARTVSQVTVFRARPLVSFLHAFIFYGFIFYLLVNVFDGLRGLLPETWLGVFTVPFLAAPYRLLADVLTVLILVGVAYFLVRRFGTKDPRLEQNDKTMLHEKVKMGSIKRDSLIVGVFILLHVGFRLMGESFLLASEGFRDPWQPFASTLAGAFGYGENRIIGWHVGWWGALGLILAFLPYFPRSKHLHLFGAPR